MRVLALNLARSDTGSGAHEWFNVPIIELYDWYDFIDDISQKK